MLHGDFKNYWAETASSDAIVPLISMNYDGLQFAIIKIISGAEVKVDTAVFTNDPSSIASKDDVLTYMVQPLPHRLKKSTTSTHLSFSIIMRTR